MTETGDGCMELAVHMKHIKRSCKKKYKKLFKNKGLRKSNKIV